MHYHSGKYGGAVILCYANKVFLSSHLRSLLTATSRTFDRLQSLPLPLDLTAASRPCHLQILLPPLDLAATSRICRCLQAF